MKLLLHFTAYLASSASNQQILRTELAEGYALFTMDSVPDGIAQKYHASAGNGECIGLPL
jgi:hypothetical protein